MIAVIHYKYHQYTEPNFILSPAVGLVTSQKAHTISVCVLRLHHILLLILFTLRKISKLENVEEDIYTSDLGPLSRFGTCDLC